MQNEMKSARLKANVCFKRMGQTTPFESGNWQTQTCGLFRGNFDISIYLNPKVELNTPQTFDLEVQQAVLYKDD